MQPGDITVDVSDDGVISVRAEHSEVRRDKDRQGRVFRSERVRSRWVGGWAG
jgi:hypothetical protein